ncbi:hypothetical protein F5X97DRAFT_342594 [Nemania serpens]|nr:hypothetical protein F5X97DRAFT_342594 [Nemania serpens]
MDDSIWIGDSSWIWPTIINMMDRPKSTPRMPSVSAPPKPRKFSSLEWPGDRHNSINTTLCYKGKPPAPLASWQIRWNVEWLNEAIIPFMKKRFRDKRPRSTTRGCDKAKLDSFEDDVSCMIEGAIEAGFVKKENAHKRTRLHRAIRRCTWRLQLVAHEFKAFKKCWREFKNKDKLWRVTAVMEEQGENPRWQAEMTFTFQPTQYEEMTRAGEWIEFPSPEDIKWFWVTGPEGFRRLHATDQGHWGPDPDCSAKTIPFGHRNGCIVRHPEAPPPVPNPHLFVEQRRCSHCGCVG